MFGQPDTEHLAEVIKQVVRVGVVVNTYPEKATVRVKCSDADGLVTWPLRVLSHKTHKDKAYWMPDIGEHVLCVFLPYGHEQGFVIGALYSDKDQVPVASQDKRHVLFDDGTWLEYDRKEHNWHGHIKGKVADLTVDQDVNINVGGNVNVQVQKSVHAIVGQDLTAEVGGSAEVSAGQHITLNAPQINLQGNLSAQSQGGGIAQETKSAVTEHTGSYTLNGDLQVNGNINATGSIVDAGGNTNHHSH
jgi:phage baseplate assembly protein V